MSWEGYEQLWCAEGHLTAGSAEDHAVGFIIEDSDSAQLPSRCKVLVEGKPCGAIIVYRNLVDETNFESEGYIEPVLVTPERIVCPCCKEVIKPLVTPATYEIPT